MKRAADFRRYRPNAPAVGARLRALLIGLVFLGVSCPPTVAEQSESEWRGATLEQALSDWDEAVRLSRAASGQAIHKYREAAGGFRALIESGLSNAALEYNLGNACFRQGELGRAILHYRRAERLDPLDKSIQANLEYARDQVTPRISPSRKSQLWRNLLFWHYRTAMSQRLWALTGFSVIGWGLLLVWLRWRLRYLAMIGLVSVVLATASSLSLIVQIRGETDRPAAVVVDGPADLLYSRGDTSRPVLDQPLGAGVEVRLLQQRGDWAEVRLSDGKTGWLPVDSLARV
jgi:hypothetical protein